MGRRHHRRRDEQRPQQDRPAARPGQRPLDPEADEPEERHQEAAEEQDLREGAAHPEQLMAQDRRADEQVADQDGAGRLEEHRRGEGLGAEAGRDQVGAHRPGPAEGDREHDRGDARGLGALVPETAVVAPGQPQGGDEEGQEEGQAEDVTEPERGRLGEDEAQGDDRARAGEEAPRPGRAAVEGEGAGELDRRVGEQDAAHGAGAQRDRIGEGVPAGDEDPPRRRGQGVVEAHQGEPQVVAAPRVGAQDHRREGEAEERDGQEQRGEHVSPPAS